MSQDSADLREVRRIVLRGLEGRRASVYLFGSWARGEASRVQPVSAEAAGGIIDEAMRNSRPGYRPRQ